MNPPGPGINAYLTTEYREMNRYLYDLTSRESLDHSIASKVEALQSELIHLEATPSASLLSMYPSYDGKHFYRGMDFSNHEDLVCYLGAHPVGRVIEYPAFTSTSVTNTGGLDGRWNTKGVQIKIVHKKRTTARHLDPFKKKRDEGEMLYPYGQRFRVLGKDVTETMGVLPPSLRDPLLTILGSTSEGFGISNLPLKALSGSRPVSSLMDWPEFTALLKRGKGAEHLQEDTVASEVVSLSKIKGGKLSLYRMATRHLLEEEGVSTGETEIAKVNIYLEEV